ncbi:AAA domain-containing protein [Halobacillus halophilus]|uniref:AAA domain-containing protein n=1 Tax=Halobacillus halophilus TaxID=1570 RepID=UPI001CD23D6E|nr:AAA domain-containing protein [Halobacillus halophilus]MCA1011748.1 AAA family ATPase [Halobacillus halophilus]
MNLYYNALFEDSRIAANMTNAVSDNLSKFERYLNLAINTLRDKKHLKAKWDRVDNPSILSFKPLTYELIVEKSISIEVFIEERFLELNVHNSVLFDHSHGIRLDQNWTPLLPEQFTFYSISSHRHVVSLSDWDLYKGEKQASTIDGSSAYISPFNFSSIQQDGRELPILDKQYDHSRRCYILTVSGEVDEESEIFLNGLHVDVNDWYTLVSQDTNYKDERDNPLPVRAIQGNTMYIDASYPVPSTVYQGQKQIPFKVKEITVPRRIDLGKDKITVDKEADFYTTLANVDFIGEGYEYFHPTLNIPLFLIELSRKHKQRGRKGQIAIRLREDDEEDFFSKSAIDYFFEQETRELEGFIDGKRVEFQVTGSNEDERILFLKGPYNGSPLEYEDIPEVLSIKISTLQLKMQRDALIRLKNTPLLEHKPLIKLSQKKERSNVWTANTVEEVYDWKVLTESEREGVRSQRDFVQKALSTPDFALLEGPPGSGKTTTILELILQLIKRGKRILLCGSTHVAIDNVLERLKDRELMEGIFPMRIGNVESVSEKVREFCWNSYQDHKFGNVMMEAANLVCGTTIGILGKNSPLFQLEKNEPAVPIFDYLIIDESSKTTFQEFLIPALFAKKWILVGDIKQLPPFNDRDQIQAGIDDDMKLKPPLKRASLLIYQYLHNHKVKMPVCIVEPEEVMKEIGSELSATNPADIKKRVVLVEEEPSVESVTFVPVSISDIRNRHPKVWTLNGADVLFISEKVFQEVQPFIPAHMVVLKEGWEGSAHHYQVNALYGDHPKELHQALKFTWKKDRKRELLPIDFLYEQQKFLKEKSWSSEYGWRMVRIFELENVENSRTRQNYKKNLELLAPKTASEWAVREINNVGDVALPSILQALQVGVGKNRERSLATTLNSGFNKEEKKSRFVTLDYQHRMHPDISKFPRKQFYNDLSLMNSAYTQKNREWSYPRYQSRNIWLDVQGWMKRSSNEAEASAIISEIKHFVKWAALNPSKDPEKERWEIACLSFYNGQRKLMADKLKELTGQKANIANFSIENVDIKNYTVDKFQGQEADITFLSMVRTDRGMGFMDNPNRLNVGITRARFQRIIVGKYHYFLKNNQSEQLELLARESVYMKNN